jgi:hypothetical protein
MAFAYQPPGSAFAPVRLGSSPNTQWVEYGPVGPGTYVGPGRITGNVPSYITNMYQNPLYQLAQQGPNISGDVAANRAISDELSDVFAPNVQWANRALRFAFDPREAMFKQRQQDLIDATRAGEAARGISMTPYGAGIEANAVGRFYNDWQNEQIQRMYVGSQTATGLQNVYANALMGAAQIRDNLIKDELQAYGLKGEALNNAMNSVLRGLDIEAQVAMAGLQSQTQKDVATTSGSAQVASAGIHAGAQVASAAIGASSKGGK